LFTGLGTLKTIGTLIDSFDYNVPYNIFGKKSLSLGIKNLKYAELFPGLYNLSSL